MKNKPILLIFIAIYFFSLFFTGIILNINFATILIAALLSAPPILILVSVWYMACKLRKKSNPHSLEKFSMNLPEEEKPSSKNNEPVDHNKRQLIKLLGSLGIGTLIFSLFNKKVSAVQFGGTGIPDPIGIEPLGGSQTTGSTTLTSANTWYQVPSSNLSSRVFLSLHNRSGYDMYWTFDNSVNSSTGGMLFPDGANLMLDVGNAVSVYVRCGTASQECWYAESQSQ